MDEGNIDLSKTMLELGINDYPDQLTPTEKTATVRMLLQSRSGIYIEAACETQEAKDTRPPRGSHLPGTFFYYNNWSFNAAGTVFQQETGVTIHEEFKNKFHGWLFGCDICQDVCPWNQKFAIKSLVNEFHPQKKELFLNDVLEMKEEEFRTQFKHSPVKRAKLSGIKRNAAFLKRK